MESSGLTCESLWVHLKVSPQEQPPSPACPSLLHPISLPSSVLSTYLKIGKKKKKEFQTKVLSQHVEWIKLCASWTAARWGAQEKDVNPQAALPPWQLPYVMPACAPVCPTLGSPVWLGRISQRGAPPLPRHGDHSFTSHITLIHTQKQKQKQKPLHSMRNPVNKTATTLNSQ